MKKYKTFLIVIVLVAILAFLKVQFLSPVTNSTPSAQPGKLQAIVVTAYVVKPEKLDNRIFVSGSILANEEVLLVPETSGKVISISFKEGSKVAAGDLLVKINDAELQAQLKKLKIQEKLASDNEVREKKLLEANGISQMEYDGVLTHMNSLRADIELVQAQITKTEIRAPFDGTIGLKYVSEGSYVNQTTRIASVQQLDPLKIDFSIPEKYSSLIKINDTLRFSVEANKENYAASVVAIEPKVDVSTRTIQVRAITKNRAGKIFPGSFARIEFSLNRSENAVMIPTEAVIPILKGQKVFVSRINTAEEAIVQTGFRTDEKVQILKGVQQGDTIITTGIMQLKAGSPLKIVSVK